MKDNIKQIYISACEVLEDHGYESDFREDYSGRGMYGKSVPAIVSDAPGTMVSWSIIIALIEHGDDVDNIDARSLDYIPKRQDSMGLSYVFY